MGNQPNAMLNIQKPMLFLLVQSRLRFRVMGWVMVFNTIFNIISAISWWSVLLVEETGVTGEKPPTCFKSLTNSIT
jgi:hypothetical protein